MLIRILLDLIWSVLLFSILIYFWRARRKTVLTKYWRKTSGRITHFEWELRDYRLWPKIEYVYEVDHQDYTGENYFIDKIHNDFNSRRLRKLAFKIASAYKDDLNIDIFYNPDDPNQSVLDIKVPYKLNIILTIITILLALHMITVTSHFLR